MTFKFFLNFTAIIIIVRSQNRSNDHHHRPIHRHIPGCQNPCDNETKCIYDSIMCNGVADCKDESDELWGCLQKNFKDINTNAYFHQEFAYHFKNSPTCLECYRYVYHAQIHETITKYVGEEFTLQFNDFYDWRVSPIWRKEGYLTILSNCVILGRGYRAICSAVNLQSSGIYMAEIRVPILGSYLTQFYSQRFKVIVLESIENNNSAEAQAKYEKFNKRLPHNPELIIAPNTIASTQDMVTLADELVNNVKEFLKNMTPDQREEAFKLITASISKYISYLNLNDGKETEPHTEHPQTAGLPTCQNNAVTIILL